jgi:hypothetical protein
MQDMARLATIPGMRPELLSSLLPYAQSQAQFKALESASGMQPGLAMPQSSFASGALPSNGQQTDISSSRSTQSGSPDQFVTEADMAAINAPEFVADPAMIQQLALQYHRQNPALYPTIESATNRATQDIAQKSQQIEADRKRAIGKQATETNALTQFQTNLVEKLQKENIPGTWSDLPAQFQDHFISQIKQGLVKNVPVDKLVREVASDALEFAKSRSQLRNAGGVDLQKFGKYKTKIDSAKKAYTDLGFNELLKDDLVAYQGISPEQAANEAYGVPKEIKSVISKIPKQRKLEQKSLIGNSSVPDQLMDKIISSIGPEDNLQAIQWELYNSGFDDRQFIEAIQKSGKQLSKDQKNQLNRLSVADGGLYDWWYKFLVK